MRKSVLQEVEPEVLEEALNRLIAVAGSARVRQLQLQRALLSRVTIEQAKGILAERHAITPEAAFEILRRSARNQRRPLAVVCGELVASIGRNGGSAAARRPLPHSAKS